MDPNTTSKSRENPKATSTEHRGLRRVKESLYFCPTPRAAQDLLLALIRGHSWQRLGDHVGGQGSNPGLQSARQRPSPLYYSSGPRMKVLRACALYTAPDGKDNAGRSFSPLSQHAQDGDSVRECEEKDQQLRCGQGGPGREELPRARPGQVSAREEQGPGKQLSTFRERGSETKQEPTLQLGTETQVKVLLSCTAAPLHCKGSPQHCQQ